MVAIQRKVQSAREEDLPRVHQLFTKTNQLNLTTIRYTPADVERFAASPDHEFWVARARDRFGDLGTIAVMLLEKPQYASPEPLKGEPTTTASDIYTLGVLLYLLLTGRSPYGAPPAEGKELTRAVCDEDPPRPSEVIGPAPNGRGPQGEIRLLRRRLAKRNLWPDRLWRSSARRTRPPGGWPMRKVCWEDASRPRAVSERPSRCWSALMRRWRRIRPMGADGQGRRARVAALYKVWGKPNPTPVGR